MLSLIVAVSENDVIGRGGKIPWRLPSEQALFKQTTMGHPVIMGRKTHESIGRALPGRTNIVITRQKNYKSEGCVTVNSLEQAMAEAKKAPGSEEAIVIGGSEIYEQAMPLADRIYLTLVHTNIKGDTFFKFDPSQWQEVSREEHNADDQNPCDYDFMVLERKKTGG